MADFPDLPRGFEWWSGERSTVYYTRWFGTRFRMGGALAGKHGLGGYQGEVYWDKLGDGDHHVQIYPVLGVQEWGDPNIGEYAVVSGRYNTEQDALYAVPELISQL